MISFGENAKFDGFGPSSLASAYRSRTQWLPLQESKEVTRRSIRERCPAVPGVYGMIGIDRVLTYVGESKSVRKRLSRYFSGKPAFAKVRRIAEEARYLVWEETGHEFTALLRELELIRRWRPRLNVRGKPGRWRRAYLCIDRGPAAQAHLSGHPSKGEGWTFGPLPANRQYRRSVRRLNDCFGLRDCRRRFETPFSDQMELFLQQRDAGCIRGVVGTCLAPCATACSREEYRDRIGSAVGFLTGANVAVLDRLQAEMQSAAGSQKYELAARLRDAHEDLGRLANFLQRLREVRRYSFVYPTLGQRGKQNWYLIRGGQVVAVERRPRSRRSAARFLKALNVVFPPGALTRLPAVPEDLDVVLLVAAWFRKHPDELAAVFSPDEARRLCG